MEAADANKGWKFLPDLTVAGPEVAPVLTHICQALNGGSVGWEDCAVALTELESLREDPVVSAWLVDAADVARAEEPWPDGARIWDAARSSLGDDPHYLCVGGPVLWLLEAAVEDIMAAGLSVPRISDAVVPAGPPGTPQLSARWLLNRPYRYIQNVIRDVDATKGSGSRLLRLLLDENTWPGETLALHARAAPVSRREHPDARERGHVWQRRQEELIVMYEALGFVRVHKDEKHPLMVRDGT